MFCRSDMVIFKLVHLMNALFGYLVLSLAPLFVPCWYEFLLFGIVVDVVIRICFLWELVRFFGFSIHSFLEWRLFVSLSIVGSRRVGVDIWIPHLHTPTEFRRVFCDLLVLMFCYDFGLIVVRMSLSVLCLIRVVFAWVIHWCGFVWWLFWLCEFCLSHSIKGLC